MHGQRTARPRALVVYPLCPIDAVGRAGNLVAHHPDQGGTGVVFDVVDDVFRPDPLERLRGDHVPAQFRQQFVGCGRQGDCAFGVVCVHRGSCRFMEGVEGIADAVVVGGLGLLYIQRQQPAQACLHLVRGHLALVNRVCYTVFASCRA